MFFVFSSLLSTTYARGFSSSIKYSVITRSILPISLILSYYNTNSPSSLFVTGLHKMSTSSSSNNVEEYDPVYPGTAVLRMNNARSRARSLTSDQLNGEWERIRKNILWAGGLRDLTNVSPGLGYTGHSFNDFNHCDLTTMLDQVAHNENEGRVAGIAYRNPLGRGIRIASMEELGPVMSYYSHGYPSEHSGGSWSTCLIGCNQNPPQDVAHVQFKSRIAFKLVWVPPGFTTFVLVDDEGALLNQARTSSCIYHSANNNEMGTATSNLPDKSERWRNYEQVKGSKYAVAADTISSRLLLEDRAF